MEATRSEMWSASTYTKSCLDPTCTIYQRNSPDAHKTQPLHGFLWVNVTWDSTEPGNDHLRIILFRDQEILLDRQGASPLNVLLRDPPSWVFVGIDNTYGDALGTQPNGSEQEFRATATTQVR